MVMKKKHLVSLHDKAIRLLEGQFVEVQGFIVQAKSYCGEECVCNVCEMDCLCHKGSELCEVCMEINAISSREYYLAFFSS